MRDGERGMRKEPAAAFFPLFIRWMFVLALLLFGMGAPPLFAQEKVLVMGEGDHRGFIASDGQQALKIAPIKPGQTLQLFLAPRWEAEKSGRMRWKLEDQDGVLLKSGSQDAPAVEEIFLEWTSNSQPRPSAYLFTLQFSGGTTAGEPLGEYTLRTRLWDQNDGNAGTDAPEAYEKALLLEFPQPGTYLFEENYISGTADIYDIYKISLKPNHSLSLQATPREWRGTGKGQVRWELLKPQSKGMLRMKEGTVPFPRETPFLVKVFHPQIKADTREAIFFLLVKIEGEVNMIYSLQAEVKEGR